MPTITVFAASPDRGRGHARDMRVRWALEELNLGYDVRRLSFAQLKEPAHLALQPFGQIPTFEDGVVRLFDSGAIVLHLALSHPGLLPDDSGARALSLSWMFAAVSTIEPTMLESETAQFTERDKPWAAEHLAMIEARTDRCLGRLQQGLGRRDWLAGPFTAADILMVHILKRMGAPETLSAFPTLAAYAERGTSRPAYARAFEAQRAIFTALDDKG